MSPIRVSAFFMGVDDLKVACDFSFFHIGGSIIQSHKLAHINNPWFFIVIFIWLLIIRFIVINVQIGSVRKHGNKTSTIRSIPCPTILNIYFLVKSVHVRKMATWCLHKFPFNAHSHVQQAYLVKRSGTLYVIFGCCWLCTIHPWPISFKSSIPWVTLVGRINVAFSTLIFTIRSITLFLMNPHFFISVVCM